MLFVLCWDIPVPGYLSVHITLNKRVMVVVDTDAIFPVDSRASSTVSFFFLLDIQIFNQMENVQVASLFSITNWVRKKSGAIIQK